MAEALVTSTKIGKIGTIGKIGHPALRQLEAPAKQGGLR